MGGFIDISPRNKVLYHYVSESVGDFPEELHSEIIRRDEENL
jgi:hypothetical protein